MNIQRYTVKPGSLKNLQLIDDTLPPPAAGEVQVAVKTVGLNFADVFCIWGFYKAAPKETFTPGLEYAGEIVAVGEGVSRFKPGDRVMGITRFGGFTTGININEQYVVPIPADWDYTTGAAFWCKRLLPTTLCTTWAPWKTARRCCCTAWPAG